MPVLEKIIEDVLMDPLEKILFHTGRGIATAQMELDKNSLATQILLENDEDLSQFGIRATWYHFPETTIEIKMSLSMHEVVEKKEGKLPIRKYKIYGAPMNANYRSSFNYDAAGASLIKAKIVTVPPPAEAK